MAIAPDSPTLSLRTVMRPAPQISPEDSLERFINTIRYLPVTTLPVVHHGRLCGIVRIQDVLRSLTVPTNEAREDNRLAPISSVMVPPPAIIRPEMTPEEAGRLCAEQGELLLPVVDEDNYCLGVVVATDLFAPDMPAPSPPRIGGMATPFGVYLTDGTHQAGAGNFALMASGAAISLLMVLTVGFVEGGLWLGRMYGWLPSYPEFRLDSEPSLAHPMLVVASLGLRAIALIVFLSLLRFTRIAGYHAAEHQTVHALERGERLIPEIVGRMPRPHPRCGTNLMAAGILFSVFWQIFSYVPILLEGASTQDMARSGGDSSVVLFAVIASAFLWRPFGAFLQEWFTTKPASQRELASGIAAGEELIWKYRHSPPTRPRFWSRLWNMGLVQTTVGMLLTFSILDMIPFVRSLLS